MKSEFTNRGLSARSSCSQFLFFTVSITHKHMKQLVSTVTQSLTTFCLNQKIIFSNSKCSPKTTQCRINRCWSLSSQYCTRNKCISSIKHGTISLFFRFDVKLVHFFLFFKKILTRITQEKRSLIFFFLTLRTRENFQNERNIVSVNYGQKFKMAQHLSEFLPKRSKGFSPLCSRRKHWQNKKMFLGPFKKIKRPKGSICSEMLDAESFKVSPDMLIWDALKEVQKLSEQKKLGPA